MGLVGKLVLGEAYIFVYSEDGIFRLQVPHGWIKLGDPIQKFPREAPENFQGFPVPGLVGIKPVPVVIFCELLNKP
jgi:hypothetical protein